MLGFRASTFGEDQFGEVYVARLQQGEIYKIKTTACQIEVSVAVQDACNGENGSATFAVSGGMPPYTYTVEGGHDPSDLMPGEYMLMVEDAAGCCKRTYFTVADLMITEPVVTQSNDTLMVNDIYMSYQWLLDGMPVVGATSSIFVPTESGTYTVLVTADNGCTATSDPVLISSVRDLNNAGYIHLSPNPCKDILHIHFDKPLTIYALSVYDIIGNQVIYAEDVVRNIDYWSISLESYPTGVYSIEVHTDKGNLVEKVIKQ